MPYNPNLIPQAPLPISMLPDAEPIANDDLLLVTQPDNAQGKSRKAKVSDVSDRTLRNITTYAYRPGFNLDDVVLVKSADGHLYQVKLGLLSSTGGDLLSKILDSSRPTLDARYLVKQGPHESHTFLMPTQMAGYEKYYELLTGNEVDYAHRPTATISVPPGMTLDLRVNWSHGTTTYPLQMNVVYSTDLDLDIANWTSIKQTGTTGFVPVLWRNSGTSAAFVCLYGVILGGSSSTTSVTTSIDYMLTPTTPV